MRGSEEREFSHNNFVLALRGGKKAKYLNYKPMMERSRVEDIKDLEGKGRMDKTEEKEGE